MNGEWYFLVQMGYSAKKYDFKVDPFRGQLRHDPDGTANTKPSSGVPGHAHERAAATRSGTFSSTVSALPNAPWKNRTIGKLRAADVGGEIRQRGRLMWLMPGISTTSAPGSRVHPVIGSILWLHSGSGETSPT